jgi:hypothetical protein
MAGSNGDRGRSRRLGTVDRGWSSIGQVLRGWTIERSGDAICGLHHAQGDDEHGFHGSTSKPRSMVSPSFASKLVATVLVVWPQNQPLKFLSLGHKTGSYGLVIWPAKSPRQFLGFGLKIKWEEVCQLCLKTDVRIKMM